ncbi:MAG TPA: ferrochelatase [Polyangiaceae bacterium]|nr:ferrochelatase [Polyangiaceae bacterium]
MTADHVLLLGHGTVENLDDLTPFLANIRRGRPAPADLIHEVRRRYQLIGGSPLLRICRELAGRLEGRLQKPVHLATRFWHPFAKDVLRAVSALGAERLIVIPLAPYSGDVYESEMRRLAEAQRQEGPLPPDLVCAPNWGSEALLVDAFASALIDALAALPDSRRAAAHVFFSAHSLPLAIVEKGDRYPEEVLATANAVAARAGLQNPWRMVYQSQGGTADPWLGPDVETSLRAAADEGARDVIFCPIGFLSDHIEVLYDLDVEAKAWAAASGITLSRTRSLNAASPIVETIAALVQRLSWREPLYSAPS